MELAKLEACPYARPGSGSASLSLEPIQRLHFGESELALEPEKSAFINCPFDAAYAQAFDAIVFATVCCGFMARFAQETGTVAEPGLERSSTQLSSPSSPANRHRMSSSDGMRKPDRMLMISPPKEQALDGLSRACRRLV